LTLAKVSQLLMNAVQRAKGIGSSRHA
jgi:hypothetical protein